MFTLTSKSQRYKLKQQNKTPFHTHELGKILKILKILSFAQGRRKQKISRIAGGIVNCNHHFGKQFDNV